MIFVTENGQLKKYSGGGSGGGSADFPTGGEKGEALIKDSSMDNDVEWGTPKAAGVEMTLAQYNALSEAEKNDGTLRFITDAPGMEEKASSLSAVDTKGLIGTAGSDSNTQALLDEIADRVSIFSVANGALNITYEE